MLIKIEAFLPELEKTMPGGLITELPITVD
jgi:hypothetical protein